MKQVIATVAILFMAAAAWGADITVRGSGSGKDSVSLEGLSVSGEAADLFVRTLRNDLTRSGWFRVHAAGQITVTGTAVGRIDGLTVSSAVSWPGKRFDWKANSPVGVVEVRKLAHRLADDMVRHIKGEQGIAATRVVFVNRRGPNNADLYMCDADGGSLMRITQENMAVIGPKWDRDGLHVLYTTYLNGGPAVYRFPANGGRRFPLTRFRGMNTGARISPDGRTAVLVLSVDGNPDIYALNLASGAALRLTQTPHAVEASPAWSPDGRRVVYVSDASGAPQLYVVDVATKRSRRLTYKGTENVNPDWARNGLITYATRRGGSYQIAVLDLTASGDPDATLTSGPDHEAPSWAADSRHIVCARTEGSGRSSLWILDTGGDSPVPLFLNQGNWMSPDWSK